MSPSGATSSMSFWATGSGSTGASRGRSPRRAHQPRRRTPTAPRADPDVLFATPPDGLADRASLPSVRMSGAAARPLRSGRRRCRSRDPGGRRLRQRLLHAHALRGAVVADRDQLRALPGRGVDRRPRQGFLGVPVVDAWRRAPVDGAAATLAAAATPAARCSRSLLTHDVDDPLSTARARPARRRAPTSPATSCGRRDPRLAARRARALALRDRRPDPHNTFDFLMDIERAPRAAQRLLLPRPPRRATARRAPISSSTRGCARSSGTSRGAATRSGCTRASARTRTSRARARSYARAAARRRGRGRAPGRVGRAPALPALGQPGHVAQLGGGRARAMTAPSPTPTRSAFAPGRATTSAFSTSRSAGPAPARDAVPGHGRDAAVHAGADARRRTRGGHGVAAHAGATAASLGILWHNNTLLRTDREKRWYAGLIAAVAESGG